MDIEEWARDARPAVREWIGSLGGGMEVFDRNPLSAVPVLDDFVNRLPWQDFGEDDWVWLHAQLSAFVAEVLICLYGGAWKAIPATSAPTGWRPIIAVLDQAGRTREVDPMTLVYQELHPVPQRIRRMVERAVESAGQGP